MKYNLYHKCMFSTIIKVTCIIFLYNIEYINSGCCCCKSNQKNNSQQAGKGSNPPTTNTKTVIEENKTNIITFTGHPDDDRWVTCDSLNIVDNSKDTAKTFINEEYLGDDQLVFKLDNESFNNILNNKTKFVYNDFQGIENTPFIIFAVELCNGNHYLVCSLNTNYYSPKKHNGFFRNISELKKIKILKSGKIENYAAMFYQCTKLEYLDAYELKTKEVKSVGSMFFRCTGLKYLDLSNFNIGKASGASTMFVSCNNLEEVRTKDEKIIKKLISLGMKEVSNGLYKKQD